MQGHVDAKWAIEKLNDVEKKAKFNFMEITFLTKVEKSILIEQETTVET